MKFEKINERKVLSKAPLAIPLQIFHECMHKAEVVFKRVIHPDDVRRKVLRPAAEISLPGEIKYVITLSVCLLNNAEERVNCY